MEMVGVRELKNRLTHYLRLTKKGNKIVVTERGTPIAVLHSLADVEDDASVEERLASLAERGVLRLPSNPGKLKKFKPIHVSGKPASEIILEERR